MQKVTLVACHFLVASHDVPLCLFKLLRLLRAVRSSSFLVSDFRIEIQAILLLYKVM